MKEFLLKHPIVAFFMLSEICSMLTKIFSNEEEESAAEICIDGAAVIAKKVNDKIHEVKKDPIGFKTK